MSNLVRYLKKYIQKDLTKKMVFLAGPRQVGKTTFALSLLKKPDLRSKAYLNWDDVKNKIQLKNGELPINQNLLIIDEIHKFKNWRNLIKGFYDKNKDQIQFIITGSARLDHYSKGGDSLIGRYFFYRLHPLSVNELGITQNSQIEKLLNFGGFPEPYFANDEIDAKRWRRDRLRKIVQEDLRDLETIKEISLVEELLSELPAIVGSSISYQSLASRIEVELKTIQKWIQIFDNLYVTYRIKPYIPKKMRVIKRAEKLYFWDWGGLENKGAQFENLVGSHLLKYCHFIEDTKGDKMELKYLKDVEGREIDFIVLKNDIPQFAVECKKGDRAVSPHIYYFKQRLKIPIYYQVHLKDEEFSPESGIKVMSFINFCKEVEIP